MNRLTKTTASALLLVLMAAAPASAIYIEGADNTPAEPGMVRIMAATAPDEEPVYHILPVLEEEPVYHILPVLEEEPVYHILPVPADLPQLISAPVEPILISAPLEQQVLATRPAPVSILIDSTRITYDQKPIMINGTLMVPLRAIVEGAGGQVTWDGETRTVTVRLGDRTATFVIGQDQAEMNQDGVRYIQRNMIKMAGAPILEGGRTLVSADAMTSVLGLLEGPGAEGALNLVPAAKPGQPAEEPAPVVEAQEWIAAGTVKETKAIEGGIRILVAGPAMANGEGSLIWFTVTAETKITVAENGAQREGIAADLATAQQVEVKYNGILLKSYPAQGRADSVTIHK